MRRKRPEILITNDDGIHAEGLKALRKELSKIGNVAVVVPDREKSAVSHSITLHHPIRVTRVDSSTMVIDGTPTDCVNLAMYGLVKKSPDVIVSGINRGANLGDDVTYSGTVAASVEASIFGVSSFAISVTSSRNVKYETAARFAAMLVETLIKNPLPKRTFLNVNVPNVDSSSIRGVMVTRQGKSVYNDRFIKRKDPRGNPYFWIGGDKPGYEKITGSDYDAIEKNMISVTPLKLDLTNSEYLTKIRKWDLNSKFKSKIVK